MQPEQIVCYSVIVRSDYHGQKLVSLSLELRKER
jgi:hypothetical protein